MRLYLNIVWLVLLLQLAAADLPRACLGNLFGLTSPDAVRTNRCIAVTRYMVTEAQKNYPNISWDYIHDDLLIDTHDYSFHTAHLAKRQLDEGCPNGANLSIVIGPNQNEAAAVAAKVVGAGRVPLISPLARDPMFGDLRTYPNFYRTASSFVNEVEALFSLIQNQKWTRVAVVYSQNDVGQMIANQIPKLATSTGYALDQIEVTIPADDLGPATRRVVDNIRNLRYRVILLHADERVARLVISEMAGRGMLNGDFILLGTTYWTSSPLGDLEISFSEDEKKALTGTVGLRFATAEGPKWDAFLAAMNVFAPEYFYPYHVEPVNIAIKNCVDAVNIAIETIARTAERGLAPIGENVWQTLESMDEFEGVSGKVSFNLMGDSLTSLQVTNFVGGAFKNIGTYRQLQRTEKATLTFQTPLVFPDGSVGLTSDDVPRHLMKVPSWMLNMTYAVMAVGLIFNIVLHRLIYIQRGHEIIKASSPLFCHIIIAGSTFTYLMSGLGTISPDILCRALPGCVAATFSIIFGSLFAKTWRIHRIFNSRTLSRKAPTNRNLLIIVASLLAFEGLIQLIWMTTDLPSAIIVPHTANAFASVQVCKSDNMTAWWTLSLLPKICVLLFGIYVAYKVRLLNHNFNEAKHISMAVYNVVLMCILLLPMALLFEKDPTASFAIRTIGPMLAAMITLLLLFVPKFWDMFVTHDWVEYVSDAIYENGVLVHKSSKHSRNSHGGNSQLSGKPAPHGPQRMDSGGAKSNSHHNKYGTVAKAGGYMMASSPSASAIRPGMATPTRDGDLPSPKAAFQQQRPLAKSMSVSISEEQQRPGSQHARTGSNTVTPLPNQTSGAADKEKDKEKVPEVSIEMGSPSFSHQESRDKMQPGLVL